MNAFIDISYVTIKTPRCILRPFREEDLDDFYEYAKVPGVGEMAGWVHHGSIEVSKEVLNAFIAEKKVFAIVYNNKVIGSIGIDELEDESVNPEKLGREIGYTLSKDYWGQGLMPECVQTVIDYCFNDLKLDFLICGYFVDNYQSKRVQEKVGFKYIKQIEHCTRWGEIKVCNLNLLENKVK